MPWLVFLLLEDALQKLKVYVNDFQKPLAVVQIKMATSPYSLERLGMERLLKSLEL